MTTAPQQPTAETVVRDLTAARDRTLHLTDLDEPELLRQHDPLMSPMVWDLAHIGQQEDLWLLRGGEAGRPGVLPVDVEALYDAFTHPRAVRAGLLAQPGGRQRQCQFVLPEAGRPLQQPSMAALPQQIGQRRRQPGR